MVSDTDIKMTYRELLASLQNLNDNHLDSPVTLDFSTDFSGSDGDEYYYLNGYWEAIEGDPPIFSIGGTMDEPEYHKDEDYDEDLMNAMKIQIEKQKTLCASVGRFDKFFEGKAGLFYDLFSCELKYPHDGPHEHNSNPKNPHLTWTSEEEYDNARMYGWPVKDGD